eukprot:jgi/Phyca11/118759/e_gw1.36.312.1
MNTNVLCPPNHHALSDNNLPSTRLPAPRAVRRSTVRSTYSIKRTTNNERGSRKQRAIRTELERKRLHRERCRLNQTRFREQQRKTTRDLEEAILKLQGEIKSLETQEQAMPLVPTNPTMWSAALAYFRQFNYFMYTSGVQPSAALSFLYTLLDPGVTERSITGADALVDKWRLFSLFFEDVQVELKDLKALTFNALAASTTTHVTITEDTLQAVFPNSINDGRDARSSLAGRLVGQRVTMYGSVRFDWDNLHNRVVAVDCSADILTPLLCVLGNLQDVSRLFDKAILSPDCRFVGGNFE